MLGKIVVFLLLVTSLGAQTNPFSGKAASSGPEVVSPLAFVDVVRHYQRELHRAMVESIDRAQESLIFWPLVLLITFGYGVFHSLLPGHQKALVIGYLMNRREPPAESLVLGILMGAAHLISSLLLYFLMLLFQRLAEGTLSLIQSQEIVSRGFSILSALGILVLAIFLVRESVQHLLQIRRRKALREVAGLLEVASAEDFVPMPTQNLRWVLFVSALVPCPGTMLVLLFTFSIQAHTLGILSIAGISLGNGFLIGLLALLTILARTKGQSLAEKSGWETLAVGIQLGAVLLLAVSAVSIVTLG